MSSYFSYIWDYRPSDPTQEVIDYINNMTIDESNIKVMPWNQRIVSIKFKTADERQWMLSGDVSEDKTYALFNIAGNIILKDFSPMVKFAGKK